MEILYNIGIGILGILVYALLTVKDKGDLDTLNLSDYFFKSWRKWIVSILIITVLAIVIRIVENGGDAIESLTGLAVTTKKASFLTLGYVLASGSKKVMKK